MKYLPDGAQMKAGDLATIEGKMVPSMVLMERAALKCVERMHKEAIDLRNVLIVCGSGNNGGDGYAIARLLMLEGSHVTVVLAGREGSMSNETRLQRNILRNYGIEDVSEIPEDCYTAVIDAVFGIGLSRIVEGHYAALLEQMNSLSGRKIAVDIPSGVSSTSGEILGTAFRADLTVTFACTKRGLIFYPGADYAGKIFAEEIGIQTDLFDEWPEVAYTYEREDLIRQLPDRPAHSHKGIFGKVLMVVGSRGMSGAAYLSAKAACRTGAGLVKIYTDEANRTVLQTLLPEVIVVSYREYDEKQFLKELDWADVAAAGCGLGTGEISAHLMEALCRYARVPVVLDADGLNLLAEHMELLKLLSEREAKLPNGGLVLTPHLKEMTRLLHCRMDELLPIPERITRLSDFADQYAPAVCALKDSRTLVCRKDARLYINTTGCAAMAKGGSGDVLTGIITGFLAQHKRTYDAAVLGCCLHGLAGEAAALEKGNYSTSAEDLLEEISRVLKI